MTLRLAVIRCNSRACNTLYEAVPDDDQFFLKCPVCGQMNPIPDQLMPITGICGACGRPLDNHAFTPEGDHYKARCK